MPKQRQIVPPGKPTRGQPTPKPVSPLEEANKRIEFLEGYIGSIAVCSFAFSGSGEVIQATLPARSVNEIKALRAALSSILQRSDEFLEAAIRREGQPPNPLPTPTPTPPPVPVPTPEPPIANG